MYNTLTNFSMHRYTLTPPSLFMILNSKSFFIIVNADKRLDDILYFNFPIHNQLVPRILCVIWGVLILHMVIRLQHNVLNH